MLHQKRHHQTAKLNQSERQIESEEEQDWRPSPTSMFTEQHGHDRRQLVSERQRHLFGIDAEFDQVKAARKLVEQDDGESLSDSSVSFARSGCHSILSAWRLKANKSNRMSGRRPLSVLSGASSRKSGVSSGTKTGGGSTNRIHLGPRAAQHLVTNSKRRRRVNELILNTIEARRRTLESVAPSELLGSLSYLGDPGEFGSLSPSPADAPLLEPRRHSPMPLNSSRASLSELGSGQPVGAAQEQRQRLLREAQRAPVTPPRARPDQNSSDLCSSNSSECAPSSDSSGSQFTQLMSSELAPDCVPRLLGLSPSKPESVKEAPEGRLRRGALRRDSIRRLRLNRPIDGDGLSRAPEEVRVQPETQPQLETLPKSRRIDIENNPFLNRHHFRTTSARGRLTQAEPPHASVNPKPQPPPKPQRKSQIIPIERADREEASPPQPARLKTSSFRQRPAPVVEPKVIPIQREHSKDQHKDSELDLVTNRTDHIRKSEHLRVMEKSPSSMLDRDFSLRTELIRSTSISPPLEFADPPTRSKPDAPVRRAVSEERQAKSEATPKRDELPQFERTADAEFRKRVDYLRRLARANLESSTPLAGSGEVSKPLTKPLSTNWEGPSSSTPSPNLLSSWGRSQSSLASVGRPKNIQPQPATRPLSPTGSLQPHSQTAPTPVKLVVRERNQPKLNHASFIQEPKPAVNPRRAPLQTSVQVGHQKPERFARVSSPKSPELTTGSSNDDSAIASSVSSPSLSFATPPRGQQVGSGSPSPSSAAQKSEPTVVQARAPSGTLQSILRRQQQQWRVAQDQHQPQQSDSSDSSAEPASSSFNIRRTDTGDSPDNSNNRPTGLAKRVHFNDRTSIRSFESVSSLAESDTTQVLAGDLLRRQVGSPDSMNSASSTSRLSTESPDLRARAGAAIYAVRGDPDLELEASPSSHPATFGGTTLPSTICMTAPPSIGAQSTGFPSRGSAQGPLYVSRARAPLHEVQGFEPGHMLRLHPNPPNAPVLAYPPPPPLLSPGRAPAGVGPPPTPNRRRPAPIDLRLLNYQTEV